MAVNKKPRKTQIPEEAIKGPAGITDNVYFTGYTLGIYCEKEVEFPNKKKKKKKIEDSKQPKEVYSTDLGLGMSISVKPGGIKTAKVEKEGEDR